MFNLSNLSCNPFLKVLFLLAGELLLFMNFFFISSENYLPEINSLFWRIQLHVFNLTCLPLLIHLHIFMVEVQDCMQTLVESISCRNALEI